jgi:hypothetical protein
MPGKMARSAPRPTVGLSKVPVAVCTSLAGRPVLERITRDNSALCLIDHQVGLLIGVRDITVAELKA